MIMSLRLLDVSILYCCREWYYWIQNTSVSKEYRIQNTNVSKEYRIQNTSVSKEYNIGKKIVFKRLTSMLVATFFFFPMTLYYRKPKVLFKLAYSQRNDYEQHSTATVELFIDRIMIPIFMAHDCTFKGGSEIKILQSPSFTGTDNIIIHG